MKKKLVLLLVAAMAVSVFAGCGENENGASSVSEAGTEEAVIYTAEELLAGTDYDVKDYVKLGNWKKLEVEVDQSYEVTDELIAENANSVMANYPYYVEVDRAVKDGDVATIDYVGTIDGEEFEGGSYEGYPLTIGSGSFIEGFEDGLIGHKAGEEVVLDLTFPETYSVEEYAGKDVQFTVTINVVSEPTTITYDQITDDYVAQNFATTYGMSTVEQFTKTIETNVQNSHDVAVQKAYLEKLVEESEVTLPEGLVEERMQMSLDSYEIQCETYGYTLEEYITEFYGQTLDEYKEELKAALEVSLEQELVLEALVDELQCEVNSEEYDSFVSYFASYYYMSEDDFVSSFGGHEYLRLYYAEYYVAMEEAASHAKVTYVEGLLESTEEATTEE